MFMFHGVWQLAKRALRIESIRIGPNLMRFSLVLFLLLVIVESQLDNVGTAKGLKIFKSQILLTHLFLTINSIFGFSQVIIEEREAGTLDLLKLADINSLSIVLGKGLPRFWESLTLIAVQFPFTLLTITLGGVSWSQVFAAYVYLLIYLCLVAGIGLYFSASCRTSKAAVVTTSLVVILYLLPFVLSVFGGGTTIVTLAGEFNIQIKTMEIMQSGFKDSPWSAAAFVAIGFGCLFAVGACFNLNRASRFQSIVDRLAGVTFQISRKGRVWKQPFVWLDYKFVSGGFLRMMLRSFVHLGILFWMDSVQGGISQGLAWAALLGCPVSLIDATWSANRLFSDEVRNHTWSLLVQTPNSMRQILVQKTLGWGLGMLPAIVLPYLYIVSAIFLATHVHGLDDMMELLIGSVVTGLAVVAYLHLMVLFSLDWHWKAIPATLSVTCVLAFVYMWMLVPWRSGGEVRCAVFLFTGLVLVGICVALQMCIYNRLQTLAGSD